MDLAKGEGFLQITYGNQPYTNIEGDGMQAEPQDKNE
jgi:hypothetical protein